MLNLISTFSSYSVNDLKKAHSFYSEILGLRVDEPKEPGLRLNLTDGQVYLYPKKDHVPATFTVFNFKVNEIEKEVDALTQKGVVFLQYPDLSTDAKGISRNNGGPTIAWFKDPAGNILSLVQENS